MNESDSQSTTHKIEVAKIPGPDFTTYEDKGFGERLPEECKDGKAVKPSCACSLPIEGSAENEQFDSRALACRAYNGRFWSITLRCKKKNIREASTDYDGWVKSKLSEYAGKNGHNDKKPEDFLGYCPQGYSKYCAPVKDPPDSEIFLNDIYRICLKLYEILFNDTRMGPRPSGLIAITGATDSSKSLITTGLIFLLLEKAAAKALASRQRKPHLLTYEDPIEQYYVKDPNRKTSAPPTLEDLKELLDALYIDYTPREKGKDAGSLRDVTKDALRQTPTALFVGETRDAEDWKDLLEFAVSGHLVITTSHAGSVVEAMSSIFRNTDTKTPALRSEIARCILGIINIRSFSFTLEKEGPPIRALLPALWKNTPQSVNNLVADGLASILPAREREAELGYYGRTYFATALTDKSALSEKMRNHPQQADALREINKKAIEWDIKGA